MASRKKNAVRRRIAGAYASSLTGISLMLVLVGLCSVIYFGSGYIRDFLKENVKITVLMKSGTPAVKAVAYQRSIEKLPYVRDTRYVSVQEGTAELEQILGEDFFKTFKTSPVPSSVEVRVDARYLCEDSLAVVSSALSRDAVVDRVDTQKVLLDSVSNTVEKILMVLFVIVGLLALVSAALLSNTIRLILQSNRLSIRTMQLVGATDRFIARPYLLMSFRQGLIAALIATAVIVGLGYLASLSAPQVAGVVPGVVILEAFGVMAFFGVIFCCMCTSVQLRRISRLDNDELYG